MSRRESRTTQRRNLRSTQLSGSVPPCEGLDLPPSSLIQLIAPECGVNDAPLRWHHAWLVKQGYRKSLLEPCLYAHYIRGGSVDGLILIEVDDLAIGTKRSQEARRFASESAIQLGEAPPSTLAREAAEGEKTHSRRVRTTPLARVKDQLGCQGESSRGFRICVDLGTTLESSHRIRRPHRQSSGEVSSLICGHDQKDLRVISVSDAGGIGGPPTENGENVQNAHLIMVADDEMRQGVQAKASPLMRRSARCKRAVNSTLAGETLAMSSAVADAEWAQVMIQDVLRGDKSQPSLSGVPVQRLHSFQATSALMPADSTTKVDPSAGNDALRQLLRTGKLVWDGETIRLSAGLGRSV